MKKVYIIPLLSFALIASIESQTVKTPDEFLGYELGTQFTFHRDAVDYFKYIAEVSPLAEYRSYGRSYEGRELGICIISGEENLRDLEELRKNNLINAGLLEGKATGRSVPFIWLSYNVHGNESAGMEAAIKTLYTLVSGSYEGTSGWLKACVIFIDPCQNPDGRDLYAYRYRTSRNLAVNVSDDAWEHNQGWPGARSNHYFFDLNRDWTWQTQTESQQRIAMYNQYMPQVHADFHEMGAQSTFYFAPGADPWHETITKWQKEFHKLMGAGNAKLFDENFRMYFTKESFDLFAPSYGDTWPLFNGAMGFTYEQGGGGSSGIALKLETGDTLTLKERIDGHFLASMATIKVSFENKEKLMAEFVKFFDEGAKNPAFEYKSVIIKGSNERSNLESLFRLFDRNQIRYSYAGNIGKVFRGFDYLNNKEGEITVEKGDILVSAYQPQSHLIRVLFETDSKASDSLSYDLTAWAIPYSYNLKAYAVKEQISGEGGKIELPQIKNEVPSVKPYAFLVNYTGFNEIRFMAELFRKDIKIRYMLKPFEMKGMKFNRGSLVIARGDNLHLEEKFDKMIVDAANSNHVVLITTTTGLSESGKDLGSNYSTLKKKPVIGMLCGTGTYAGAVGELWYFFERELGYPVTLINTESAERVDFKEYDVVILAGGSYARLKDTLMSYIRQGGRLIAFESAASIFSSDKNTALGKAVELRNNEQKASEKKEKSDDPKLLRKFELDLDRRYSLSDRSAGSIYKVKLDETHPFVYGLGSDWFIIKSSNGFPFLSTGYNIGYILDKDPVSGFAGYKYGDKVKNTIVIGSERIGSGEVVYITDNPYLRAFWNSGRVLIGNIVFR